MAPAADRVVVVRQAKTLLAVETIISGQLQFGLLVAHRSVDNRAPLIASDGKKLTEGLRRRAVVALIEFQTSGERQVLGRLTGQLQVGSASQYHRPSESAFAASSRTILWGSRQTGAWRAAS